MTKLTRGTLYDSFPLRSPNPAASAISAPSHSGHGSRDFVLADMNGRDTRDNRACAACIAKLSLHEISQVNWHVNEQQPCRLCTVAEIHPAAFTKPFCDFLQENPTIFHTVEYFTTKLARLGFQEVRPHIAYRRWQY